MKSRVRLPAAPILLISFRRYQLPFSLLNFVNLIFMRGVMDTYSLPRSGGRHDILRETLSEVGVESINVGDFR
jgi:hypothetical protein